MTRPATAVTENASFFAVGKRPLLAANAGVPILDALEQASNLLATVEGLAANIVAGTGEGSEIYAIQYLTEMAKALVDASAGGAMRMGGAQ